MKYLIASDFHGSIEAYERLKTVAEGYKPDKIMLLGDLCDGNGCEPVNNVLRKIYYPIVSVRGNCDRMDFGDMQLGYAGISDCAEENGRKMVFSHGDLYNPSNIPAVLGVGDILFYGHYHTPEIAVVKGVWCVCVGSTARPRMGKSPTYATFCDGKITLFDINTGETVMSADINAE